MYCICHLLYSFLSFLAVWSYLVCAGDNCSKEKVLHQVGKYAESVDNCSKMKVLHQIGKYPESVEP